MTAHSDMTSRARILVYAPLSLNGRGVGQTVVEVVSGFPAGGVTTELFAPRTRIPIAKHIKVRRSLSRLWRDVPWKLVSGPAMRRLDRNFRRALEKADPNVTLAYFYPDPPVGLVELAHSRGIITVRELVNTACAAAGPILDRAYARLGLEPTHTVTQEKIDTETRELQAYDYFFAPNAEVEKSLSAMGFRPEQILPTSFGWNAERFRNKQRSGPMGAGGARFLFVGTLNVRKGVPELLEAWAAAGVQGELVLVGAIDEEIADIVERHTSTGRVRTPGFVTDVGELFRTADVFVFPTHEEGGPQVTYEAAGCGLPSITTAMGAGRIILDGETGIIVDAGSVPQLTNAIKLLASREDLRSSYGQNALQRARDFEYSKVGAEHYSYLIDIMEKRRRTPSPAT